VAEEKGRKRMRGYREGSLTSSVYRSSSFQRAATVKAAAEAAIVGQGCNRKGLPDSLVSPNDRSEWGQRYETAIRAIAADAVRWLVCKPALTSPLPDPV